MEILQGMLKVKAKAVESAVADLNAAEERVGNAQSEAKNFAIEWRNERARRLKDLVDDVRRLEVSLQELATAIIASGGEPEGGRATGQKRPAPDDAAGLSRRGSDLGSREATEERLSIPAGGGPPPMKKQRTGAGMPEQGVGSMTGFGPLVPLLLKHVGAGIKAARSGALPGALRMPCASLEGKEDLAAYLVVEGRESTFVQWLYWTATAFRRWIRGGSQDYNEYSRGIAQLLLLSIPGAGKTTELEMVPRQLANWLEKGDSSCLEQLQGYMFVGELEEKDVADSKLLLAALKRAVGQTGQYNTFLPLRIRHYPDANLEDGLRPQAATAVRLLFAATQYLEDVPGTTSYYTFFYGLDASVREKLSIQDVMVLLRLALDVPAGEKLVLVPLIDEAHRAEGVWGGENPEQVQWPLQFMSQIVTIVNALASTGDVFILPLTASSQYAALNISRAFTQSGQSLAAQLSLRQLTEKQQETVVLNLMNRVATANSRQVRTELPEAFRSVLRWIGGTPRLLTFALAEVGGDTWREDLDINIAKLTAHRVPGILLGINRRASRDGHWTDLLNQGCPLTRECLKRLLAHLLTDAAVRRSAQVLNNIPNSPTFGDFEAVGLVTYEIEGEDLLCDLDEPMLQPVSSQQGAAGSTEIPPQAGAAAQLTPLPPPTIFAQPTSSRAGVPAGHPAGHSTPSSAVTPEVGAAGQLPPLSPHATPAQSSSSTAGTPGGHPAGHSTPSSTATPEAGAAGQLTSLPPPATSAQPSSSRAGTPAGHPAGYSTPSSAATPEAGAAGQLTSLPPPTISAQPSSSTVGTPAGHPAGSPQARSPGPYNLRSRGRMQSPQAGAQSVGKGKTGLLVVQQGGKIPEHQGTSAKISPSKLPFLQGQLSCPAPTASPGSDKVRMSISPLAICEMLRQLNIVEDVELSIFSDLELREPALDKELADAQMIAMKTEAHGLKGRKTVTLEELVPGVTIPDAIKGTKFRIPQGHLTASGGQRTSSCKTAADLISIVEARAQDIMASMQAEQLPTKERKVVQLGVVGPGNKGNDAMLVYLGEDDKPWTIFLQTKQTSAQTAVSIKEIIRNIATDLTEVCALPQLSFPWSRWHTTDDPIPTTAFTASRQPAGYKNKLPFSGMVYIYVTDGTLSTQQNDLYEQALAAGHPWLQHTLVVSAATREGYYSRVGALHRDTLRNAVLDKLP